MRSLILGLAVICLGGCLTLKPPLCPGTRHYDPQFCRGETLTYIHNPPYMALQRKAKCEQCIDIENNCYHGVPQHCRPKWPFEIK